MSGALQAVFQNVRSFGPPSFVANIYQSTTALAFGPGGRSVSTGYIVGGRYRSTLAGANRIFVAAQDLQGQILWQKTGSQNFVNGLQYLTTSANNNIYTISNLGTASGFAGLGLSVFNFSGSLLLNVNIGSSSADSYSTGIGVDSAGDSYATCDINISSANRIGIIKVDSAGSRVWDRTFIDGSTSTIPKSSYTNSSGTTFIAGQRSSSPQTAFVAAINSSGSASYIRILGDNAGVTDVYGRDAIEDSSGNVYLVSIRQRADNGQLEIMLSKWDSSGTYQWTSSVSGVQGNLNDRIRIALDSANNIYFCTNAGELVKYNPSGVLQWQRRFTNGFDVALQSLSVTGSSVFASGHARYRVSGTDYYYAFEASVPDSGSKTGTYALNSQTYQYASTAYTTRSPSVFAGSGFLSSNSFVFSVQTPTNTYSDSSLTAAVTTF